MSDVTQESRWIERAFSANERCPPATIACTGTPAAAVALSVAVAMSLDDPRGVLGARGGDGRLDRDQDVTPVGRDDPPVVEVRSAKTLTERAQTLEERSLEPERIAPHVVLHEGSLELLEREDVAREDVVERLVRREAREHGGHGVGLDERRERAPGELVESDPRVDRRPRDHARHQRRHGRLQRRLEGGRGRSKAPALALGHGAGLARAREAEIHAQRLDPAERSERAELLGDLGIVEGQERRQVLVQPQARAHERERAEDQRRAQEREPAPREESLDERGDQGSEAIVQRSAFTY